MPYRHTHCLNRAPRSMNVHATTLDAQIAMYRRKRDAEFRSLRTLPRRDEFNYEPAERSLFMPLVLSMLPLILTVSAFVAYAMNHA